MTKLRIKYIVTMTVLLGIVGCQAPYYQQQGQHQNRNGMALFGGLAGAGIGAALSKGNSNTGENALLGAALGAVTGAAVGNAVDEVEARNQALFQQHLGSQLTGSTSINDVVSLSQAGLGDEVICTHIARHGVARSLSAQDLIVLKQSGVSDKVINAMQAPPPRPSVVAPAGQPVIVEEHYYAPPPYPWFHYRQHHRRHFHPHRRPRPGVSWGVTFGN